MSRRKSLRGNANKINKLSTAEEIYGKVEKEIENQFVNSTSVIESSLFEI